MAFNVHFIVIGAAKAGTTALHHMLKRHPQVFLPEVKETNFFTTDSLPTPPLRGPGDTLDGPMHTFGLRNFADYRSLFQNAPPGSLCGEVSPSYLYHAHVPERIANRFPNARLVAVLRNPVERAFSAYKMMVRDRRETLSFHDALDACEWRMADGWEFIWDYVGGGLYASQIERYRAHFPANRMRIYLFEEFRADPDGVFHDLCAFLGINPVKPSPPQGEINVSYRERSRIVGSILRTANPLKSTLQRLLPPPLKQRLVQAVKNFNRKEIPFEQTERDRLTRLYSPEINRLEALLERPLNQWRG